ncbi:MAG TPA: CsiV family protein [Steroidobacteraceae bacterium]|nr:CsiV family protein [Steroidobacteraceae bacterium]
MTPSSVRLRRVSGVLLIALLAPLAAFAQAGGTRTAPAQAAPSQSAPARATPAQSGPSQAAPSQAASSQATPSPATSAQGSSSQAPPTGAPASAAAPAGQAATAAPPGTTTPPTDSGPAYDIEIVIFRTQAALGQPEDWATETTASATIAGGEAASGSGVGKLLTVLPSSDYRLTAIATRLRTSGTYVPVAHAAWVQTASAWGTHAGFPLESLGVSVPGLTGVISLERGQYLHLGMTLNYTMQDPPAGLNAPPGTTFVMNETRRVRFYQRNYYDHPAFGVIALVTPARGRRAPGR